MILFLIWERVLIEQYMSTDVYSPAWRMQASVPLVLLTISKENTMQAFRIKLVFCVGSQEGVTTATKNTERGVDRRFSH